jgi:anthranilate/para-aminobenzoate synthase component I
MKNRILGKPRTLGIYPSQSEFLDATRPMTIWLEMDESGLNPFKIFQRFAGPNSFLLESAGGSSRYSFIGINPDLVFRSKNTKIERDYIRKTVFQATTETLKKILLSGEESARHRGSNLFRRGGGAVWL